MSCERDFWPLLLPRDAQDQHDLEAQWLKNLTVDEAIQHAQLHGTTALEHILAQVLAKYVDSSSCRECARRAQEDIIDREREKHERQTRAETVFAPHWPEGLDREKTQLLPCDDKGHSGASWLHVVIAADTDVHLVMQDWESYPEGMPSTTPSLRCRTTFGGGRHARTHQALLWLALAIQLDNAELESRGKP